MRKLPYFCLLGIAFVLLDSCSSTGGPARTDERPSQHTSADAAASSDSEGTHLPGDGDFRGFSWGDLWDHVLLREKAEIEEAGPHMIVYSTDLAGYECNLVYEFDDARHLYQGGYLFPPEYSKVKAYIERYEDLIGYLTDLYGPPLIDDVLDLTGKEIDKSSANMRTLKFGLIVYRSRWETEGTVISHTLASDGLEIIDMILFIPRERGMSGDPLDANFRR